MPTLIAQQLLTDLQERTENNLNKATTQWQMYPAKTLLLQPDETKWSAVQCLMHLNSYGQYYLPLIQTSIEDAEKKNLHATDAFRASFVGNWFTNLMQPKGEQHAIKKMKSPKEHTPVTNENSDAVLAEFINQQEKLLVLLERAKSINIRKAKTPISISPFITLPLGDTFRFLIAHNERHILQAERSTTMAKEKTAVV